MRTPIEIEIERGGRVTQLQEHLSELGACLEAREWAGDRTPQQAWGECERADWLLWWAARTERNSHQRIVLAVAACVRTTLRYVPAGEDRPRLAIEAAEQWAADPTEENRAAAETAGAAAETAAWAAGAAAETAAETAGAAAETAAHRKMCQIIRSMLVCPSGLYRSWPSGKAPNRSRRPTC